MIYGRVIGNELRDVPPECLPVWGQRWSGYHAPHGPSPFSTRVFSADRMSEVGPTLTSPTQFEMTLAEEEEEEDTSLGPSRLYSLVSSSPLAIQAGAPEITSQPKSPTAPPLHRFPKQPHDSSQELQRSTGYLPPPSSTCFNTTLLSRQQPEQFDVQYHASKLLSCTPPLHCGIPPQGGRGSFENDLSPLDMDRTSTSFQPPVNLSHFSFVSSPHLQHPMPPHLVPEWEFANALTQSSAYPFQPHPSSHPDNGYLFQPSPGDDQTRLIPTTLVSSAHCFTVPLLQQNGVEIGWNHASGTTGVPGIQHRNHMTAEQPSMLILPTFQNSDSPLGPPRVAFHHSVSDRQNSYHPEDMLDTFSHTEGCIPLSPNEDNQFIR